MKYIVEKKGLVRETHLPGTLEKQVKGPLEIINEQMKELMDYLDQEMETKYYYDPLIDYSYQLVREYYRKNYDIYLEDNLIRNYISNDINEMIEKIKKDILAKHGSLTNYKLAIDVNYFNRYFYLYSFEKINNNTIKGRYATRLYEEQYTRELVKFLRLGLKNIQERNIKITYYKNQNFKLVLDNPIQTEQIMKFIEKISKLLVTYSLHSQL
jgi:hypothetical protein